MNFLDKLKEREYQSQILGWIVGGGLMFGGLDQAGSEIVLAEGESILESVEAIVALVKMVLGSIFAILPTLGFQQSRGRAKAGNVE